MDQAGDPVWFRPLDKYTQNRDFKVQSYYGQPVLTMWQGMIAGANSIHPFLPTGAPLPGAHFLIIDQHYQVVRTITANMGFTADVHEFIITNRNTALFVAAKPVPADLSAYGGPDNGYINNYSIQEVNLDTGQLLFFWDVLDHVDPSDSMAPISSITNSRPIWDCFHVNSVEEGPNNTLLVSMRDMWAIYLIDKVSGNIIWQLGGKQSDFTFSRNATFSWQHDARFRQGNRISLFNNDCCASSDTPPEGSSHGLILNLDYRNMRAEADHTYYHDPLLYVSHRGNLQNLPNGNQFVGWGALPYVSEFAYSGNTKKNPARNFLYDMQFPGQNFSYRAFKQEWTGWPLYPPGIALESQNDDFVIIYASWNGATELAAWQVLAGSTPYDMSVITWYVPRTGFETKIPVRRTKSYFQVNALDTFGNIIGRSWMVFNGR